MSETQNINIIDERAEFLISPTGGNPTLRIGHFLNPIIPSVEAASSPSFSVFRSRPTIPQLKVAFNGWRNPNRNWGRWVDQMHLRYQPIWKEVGIEESILNSRYKISNETNLIPSLVERWCAETNSFFFPWGEATITLEDMVVLGGYSALGQSVSLPLESNELEEIKHRLVEARREITRTSARASQTQWIERFMDTNSEVEHQAFLSLWLSRFVFPFPALDTIGKHVFTTAIHLARGVRIALAPSVLASLYRDLRTLKQKTDEFRCIDEEKVVVWAPFQLLKVWVLERFSMLGQLPNPIRNGDPRMARWDGVKISEHENIGEEMDGSKDYFLWRPYGRAVRNQDFHKCYSENENTIHVGQDLDDDLLSFARCMSVSDLVGLDTVEKYLPHRVAMQFGMDQDIPGCVSPSTPTPKIAWENYSRAITNAKLYIPHRLFESDVTTRYLDWWNASFVRI